MHTEDNSVVEDLGLGLGLGRLGQQLQGSANSIGRIHAQEESSWRRHMSLELQPLVPSALGCCTDHTQVNKGLGKSMSVQDLLRAAPGTVQDTHHSHSLSSPSPSTSSDSHSCSQDPGGGGGVGVIGRKGGGGWGEEDLFISDREIETQGFDFLSLGTAEAHTYSSELLRTGGRAGAGSQAADHSLARGHASSPPAGNELLNTPHVRLK